MREQHRHHEASKQEAIKRRRRNVIIVLSEFLLCTILAFFCYGTSVLKSYNYEELDPDVYKEERETKPSATMIQVVDETDEFGNVIGQKEVEVEIDTGEGFRNILILGTDDRDMHQITSENGTNTDVMIIVSVNNATGDIRMVSILRDTVMKMEDGSQRVAYNKANSQFYSGISDTVSMINRNLGLDISEYVIVNWYGVATCINQLGGVEITIPNNAVLNHFNGYLTNVNEKTGIWAPQLTAPGTYLMTGTQAVAFCRIRYDGYNDTGRAANQREVIGKMLEKAKGLFAAGEVGQLLSAAETGLGNVKTNLSLPEIIYLAMKVSDFNITGTDQFPKNYTTGKYLGNFNAKYGIVDVLSANDFAGEVKGLHKFLFGEDYTPNSFIQSISDQILTDRLGR